jgi:cytoskeleton protein RodZ
MADSTEQDRTPHADDAPSPGGRLRAARERKGLTLIEVADALRLDHWLVEALERDDFAALGAPVFVKGHLRKYAALTGEPADDILLAYHQRAGVQEAPQLLDRAALLRPASVPSRGFPVAALLGVLLVGGAAGAWWWYEQPVERPAPVGAIAATSVEAEPEAGTGATPETSPPPAVSSFDSFASTDTGTVASETAANESATIGTVTDVGEASAAIPPAATAVPGNSAPGSTDATTPATGAGATPVASPSPLESLTAGASTEPRPEAVPAPAAARAGEHLLVLTFTGESWAEVQDGEGARLYYDLGQAGSRRMLRGMPPFEIYLGRYVDVSIEMDGRPRAIPAESVRGNTARFTIDPR